MKPCICNDFQYSKELYDDYVKSGLLKLHKNWNENYVDHAILECSKCGTNWEFTRDDSYHYPIIRWERVK